MLVKTLLNSLKETEYNLLTPAGTLLEGGFIYDKYRGDSIFENGTIESIKTVKNCDVLFITLKRW